MKSTLREVAARAGMSYATVSRALNSADARIAPETRLRVQRIAAEMGYQPNRAARALVTGRTQTLALWSIDGILTVDLPRRAVPGLDGPLLGRKPFVNMGVYVLEQTDYVRVDFSQVAKEAVRHLHARGCRRIACLLPDWLGWFRESSDERLMGYESVMSEIGQQPELILSPNSIREAIGPALKAYIARHGCPDGLFYFNDDVAIGAFRALRDLGLRIPQDVALVGCDGIEDTAYHDPPLSTIAQPIEEMCVTALSFLIGRIKEPSIPVQQIVLQPRLEVRGSSLP